MNHEGRAAAEAWADEAAQALKTLGFAQIDLDDLLGEPPSLAVEAALECLQLAVGRARLTNPDLDGIVTVPLPWWDSLTQESPSMLDVLAQAWDYGPGREVVGLYLADPSTWRAYEPVEEYRRDLGTKGLPVGHAAYYRTWRASTAPEEFARAIYIRTIT
jgi:hypothetical protein